MAWEPPGSSQIKPVTTAALTPPAEEIELQVAVPQPLSQADATRYQRIFALQRAAKWREADAVIASLTDKSLVGTVLAERYLHPTAYWSKYPELKTWLDRYADHHDAAKIYALALKRQPAGSPALTKPEQTAVVSNGGLPEYDLEMDGNDVTAPAAPDKLDVVARMRGALEAQFSAGRPEVIETLLSEAAWVLQPIEIDSYRARLAAQWYYLGNIDRAFILGRSAAIRSGDDLPGAYWTAGLAAWRLGKLNEARRWFEALADAPNTSPWMSSAGAYWASRVHLKAKRPQLVSHWLARAAEYPRTFYGLLARRSLDLPASFDWDEEVLTGSDAAALLQNPSGRRALALLQVGETRPAERELELLALRAGRDVGRAVLALAERANLPQLAIRLGPRVAEQDGRRHDAALYPIPTWAPGEGFTVDRALLYAFMRQESGFRPEAQSPAGAVGVMQLMPVTAAYIGKQCGLSAKQNLLDPAVNLSLAQRYIQHLFDQEPVQGDLFRLVAAYNSGPAKVDQWRKRDDYKGDPLLFIESIPSRETRQFIERVLASYWIYRNRLGQPTPSLDAIAAGEWPAYTPLDHGSKAVAQNVSN